MQGVLAAKLTFGYYGNVMQILQNHEVLFNNMAIECGRYEKRQIFFGIQKWKPLPLRYADGKNGKIQFLMARFILNISVIILLVLIRTSV
ncbi:hypothetical protein BWI97_16940 [Siphonobacter sp. BAB-5405]|nr:hypothetical protein BWI97_16940 [Siphonobacter sp. BAB-5405]